MNRVSSLWLELGVSSIIVVGGCGDYFDVHNTAVLVDNYVVSDVTARAHSVSAAGVCSDEVDFCVVSFVCTFYFIFVRSSLSFLLLQYFLVLFSFTVALSCFTLLFYF